MVYKTYISKFNTIVEDSDLNVGINPIAELNYGNIVTRMLLYFDCNKLKEMYSNNITRDLGKFKHILKLTNCGTADYTRLHCGKLSDISDGLQYRATSFDIIFFLIPKEWDGGKGFDSKYTLFNQGFLGNKCNILPQDTKKLISTDGANWYQAKNGYPWNENGVYSIDTLQKEYDKFAINESNIIIARQHFDIGNENINVDITETVNKFILGELNNYGIGIAFTPMYELSKDGKDNYVGFFTDKTNTFFEPYLESVYDDIISDDRSHFILDKWNRLYLYCNIGGNPTDLDVMPICTIDDVDYKVNHQFKGVYYVDIMLESDKYKPNTMLYDIWSNIVYRGKMLQNVELDFTLKSNDNWFNIGSSTIEYPRYEPTITGIKNNEQIHRGDIRKLNIIARVPYNTNKAALINNVEIRFYVKDGDREIDVIPYDKVNKTFLENYYMIDTNMLIPNQYFVDVRLKYNGETIIKKEILEFTILNNITNKYF